MKVQKLQNLYKHFKNGSPILHTKRVWHQLANRDDAVSSNTAPDLKLLRH